MKKYIIPVAAFIAGMAIVPSVFANGPADGGASTTIDDIAKLAACVSEGKQATCTYVGTEDALKVNKDHFQVNKSVTIDLGGKKMTIGTSADNGAFQIADDATLTIINGSIEAEDGLSTTVIDVKKGGSLVLNTDLKAKKPIVAEEPEKVVVNSAVYATGTDAALKVTGATDTFGKTASVVEINGQMSGAYSQTGYVNGTINGSVSKTGADAVVFNAGGTLTVNGRVTSTGGAFSAIYFAGVESVLNIKCATITADGAALFVNAEVASLNIKDSTLTSKNGSTINGDHSAKVGVATIDGSHLVAKSDAKVKTNVDFTAATYDGVAQAEGANVLANATGSYGTLAACDAAVEPGEEGEEGEESENPNTADTIATYLTIATVALLGLGATAFVAKKSNR